MLTLLIPGVGMGGGLASAPIFTGSIPDKTETQNTGTHAYQLGVYFSLANSYSIAPPVQPGWSFDTTTAELDITTAVLGAFGPFTITATNAAGSTPSNAFNVTVIAAPVVATDEQSSGGWIFGYDAEIARRRRRKQEREELEQETEEIEAPVDREIAQFLREQEAKDERREELERIRELARTHASEVRDYGEKVSKALDRALEKATFSAAEALERELERARTDEDLAMLIMQIVLQELDD